MYPNDFQTREDYCNNCNSQYNNVKQLCTSQNMNRMLDQRSRFDQQQVPFYNKLALDTLTYPAMHPDNMPRLSPYNGWPKTGQGGGGFIDLGSRSPHRPTHRQWQRENYGNSKLKDLQVDVYYSGSCGHCSSLLKALKDAGETENVTLKNVSDPKHSAEMKKHKLGGGVPAMRSNTTGKTQIGNPGTVDALVAKLS